MNADGTLTTFRQTGMSCFRPATLSEAFAIMAGGEVSIIAGGTDFFPLHIDRRSPPQVLDITAIPELRGVTQSSAGWRIGATATWSDVNRAALPPVFDGLKAAAREVGSVQIQNAGTVAGNLCNASPAADGVPPLLTLDATVELRSASGGRRVALADFITGVRATARRADEIVCALHIPAGPGAARGAFRKLGSRRFLVISIDSAAATVVPDANGRINEARVAVGACSPVARRLPGLEAALVGESAASLADRPDIWSAHLGPLSPLDDVRGSAAYRLEAAAELCRRAVMDALAGVAEPSDE